MWIPIAHAIESWSTFYADSAALRTAVGFAHVAGLVVSGGAAITEDRAILAHGQMPSNGAARKCA